MRRVAHLVEPSCGGDLLETDEEWLGFGQMQLRGRRGAGAELSLRVLAYFLALGMFGLNTTTLAQLTHWLRQQSTFAQLINEHFQLALCGCS